MNDSNLRLFTTKINFKEKHQTLLINYFFSIFIFLSFLLPSKSYAACPAYVGSAGAETITEGGITYDVIYFAHPGLVSPTSGLLGSSTNPITDWNSSNGGMDAINDCAGDIYMKFITSCNYNSNGTGGDMTYTAQFINASINNVIIDGQGSIITNFAAAASWIRVDGRTNWKIRNLSFIGYNANAILFTDMINTRIENCIFDSNPTMRAVRIDNDDNASDVTIINSVFSNNSPVSETPSTGALEIREDEFAGPLVVHITDTDFSCNRTQGFGGGAIWISVTSFPSNGGPTVNITGGTFSGNFSGTDTGDGGAIGINGSTSVLNINGSTFSCNHSRASTGAGGGGAIRIAAGPDVTIQNATFYGNYCTNSAGSVAAGGYGGAINISSTSNISTLSISNSTFEANQASRGGAFYLENGTTPVTFNNVLIKGNSSASEGGGGIFSDGVSFSLTNTSVINNTSPATFAGGIAGSGTVTLTNSLISGNSAPETSGVTLSGSSSGAGTTTPMSSITSCPLCIPAISTTCDANGGDAITITGCNNFCSSSAGGSPVSQVIAVSMLLMLVVG
ncbi:MAG: hypothetical protein IPO94_04905 [Saprospiraceae bacterium]|nr:hypothetical protein [Saprospiraceae bacterium]